MVESTMELMDWFRKQLEEADGDVLAEMLRIFAETLMDTDASAACNAGFNEKSPDRTNTRNGYRSRAWDTRAGTIDLAVPKLRQGSYFPSWLLEPRRRAEKALIAVVADCYLAGVSTRRVDKLVKTLGIEGISKSQVSKMAKSLDEMVESFRNRPLDAGPYAYLWLDALVQKSREGGRIVNVATLTAIGVNADGHREVLGVDVVTSEDGAGWLDFLRGLKARGLSGGRPHHIGCPPGTQRRDRGHLPGSGLAALPHPLHAQPVVPGAQGQSGPGGDCRSLHLRPAGCGLGKDAARARGGAARGQVRRCGKASLRSRGRDPGLRVVPQGALASGLEQQPAGKAQPGDQEKD